MNLNELSQQNTSNLSQNLITTEQNDLNEIYKSGRRYKRTSYNCNFQNVDDILASFARKNETVTIHKIDSNKNLDEENISSPQILSIPVKRTSWFTQNHTNNIQNFVTSRKSFFRPKTPIMSLDARRKNLPESFARDQKYSTATNLENLSKRTGDLIERFRNNYEKN